MDYLYQDGAKWDLWFKVALVLPLVIIGFAFFSDFKYGEEVKYIVIAIVAVIGFIFWVIMPRRFFVLDDRIKFVQQLGFSFSISYDRIETAHELTKSVFNINLTTSNSTAIELVMKRGMNINFSPQNRDEFIKELNGAIKKWRTDTGK